MELVAVQPDATSVHDGDVPEMGVTIGTTTWTVPGAYLEGLWRVGRDHLAATTDDIPYEDGLHLCLLSEAGTVEEELTCFSPYSTGTFKLLGASGATLTFTFFDTPPWTLTIDPEKQFRLPFSGTLKGTKRRPMSLQSRLTLTA